MVQRLKLRLKTQYENCIMKNILNFGNGSKTMWQLDMLMTKLWLKYHFYLKSYFI